LFEIVGNADNVAPEQIGETGLNVGIIFGFTTIVNVLFVAHCPTVGVNVYVVVAKLFKAGDQVPVTELVEVVGKADKVAPEHTGLTAVNVGVAIGFTVIVNVPFATHCPDAGVNV
jgi:hypothetical protein